MPSPAVDRIAAKKTAAVPAGSNVRPSGFWDFGKSAFRPINPLL
jgi:hypothetical protein